MSSRTENHGDGDEHREAKEKRSGRKRSGKSCCLCELFRKNDSVCRDIDQVVKSHGMHSKLFLLPPQERVTGGIRVRAKWLEHLGIDESELNQPDRLRYHYFVRWVHFPSRFWDQSEYVKESSKPNKKKSFDQVKRHRLRRFLPFRSGDNLGDAFVADNGKQMVIATPCVPFEAMSHALAQFKKGNPSFINTLVAAPQKSSSSQGLLSEGPNVMFTSKITKPQLTASCSRKQEKDKRNEKIPKEVCVKPVTIKKTTSSTPDHGSAAEGLLSLQDKPIVLHDLPPIRPQYTSSTSIPSSRPCLKENDSSVDSAMYSEAIAQLNVYSQTVSVMKRQLLEKDSLLQKKEEKIRRLEEKIHSLKPTLGKVSVPNRRQLKELDSNGQLQ